MRGRREDVVPLLVRVFSRALVLFLGTPLAVYSGEMLRTVYTVSMRGPGALYSLALSSPGTIVGSLVAPLYILQILFMRPQVSFLILVLVAVSGTYPMDAVYISIAMLLYTLVYDVVVSLYREGETRYLRIAGERALVKTLVSAVIVVAATLVPVYLGTLYVYQFLESLRGLVRPGTIYEAPVVRLLVENPVGVAVVVVSLLSALSLVLWDIFTVSALFIARPGGVGRWSLFRDVEDLDTSFDQPLRGLRDLLFSLLLAPFVYVIVSRVSSEAVARYLQGLWYGDIVVALVSFVLSWVLVKIFFTLVAAREYSLRNIATGASLVAGVYIVAYLFWGWSPSSGYIELRPVDQFIYTSVYRYYSVVYYFIEILGRVMGVVP